MDAINGALSPYGLIGQIGIAARALDGQEGKLTGQATSGLVATGVTGLGEDTSRVLNLQPQLAQLGAFDANATLAGSRLQTAQAALTSISSIAQAIGTSLTQLGSVNGSNQTSSISSIASAARNDLQTVVSTLNTTSGDVYVFGGTDETTPPVPDPNSVGTGPLSASVASAVGGLAANGASATLSSIIAAVSGNSIFAPGLTASAAPTVDVGFEDTVTVGLPATSGAGLGGASPTSTGSGVNDLVAVLSALSSLTPSQASDPQFGALLSGLGTMLTGAQGGVDAMASTLGVSQQQVTAASATNTTLSDALSSQIGSLTGVDLPTVATQLTATQNQLMASYEIISDLKSLSLAAYL